MGEQLYPHHPGRPNTSNNNSYDIYTPHSAVCDFYRSDFSEDAGTILALLYSQYHQVSSFNLPCNYDSTLITPVSQNADSPVLAMKVAASPIHWNRDQHQMNYPMRESGAIFNQNTNARMKSNAKDSPLSLQVPQDSSGDLPLNFSPYMFDSPQNTCPPTPYWGSYGVSGPQVTSPAASIPSNAHSTPQLTNASTPSMNHTPINHNNAPILIQPTPGQLRPGKRAQESPIKTDHQAMQFQHHPAQQHSQSPHHFNPPMKRESPPLSMAMNKRRKPSDPITPVYALNHRTPSVDTTTTALSVTLQGNQARHASMSNQTSQYMINEDEGLLLHLRDEREPKPDWKKTAAEFNERTGKSYRVPALQMRYQRLKERLRPWTEKDVSTHSSLIRCYKYSRQHQASSQSY